MENGVYPFQRMGTMFHPLKVIPFSRKSISGLIIKNRRSNSDVSRLRSFPTQRQNSFQGGSIYHFLVESGRKILMFELVYRF